MICQLGSVDSASNGSWHGAVLAHHSCVAGSAAIFAWSASKSSPTYSYYPKITSPIT